MHSLMYYTRIHRCEASWSYSYAYMQLTVLITHLRNPYIEKVWECWWMWGHITMKPKRLPDMRSMIWLCPYRYWFIMTINRLTTFRYLVNVVDPWKMGTIQSINVSLQALLYYNYIWIWARCCKSVRIDFCHVTHIGDTYTYMYSAFNVASHWTM